MVQAAGQRLEFGEQYSVQRGFQGSKLDLCR